MKQLPYIERVIEAPDSKEVQTRSDRSDAITELHRRNLPQTLRVSLHISIYLNYNHLGFDAYQSGHAFTDVDQS